MLLEISLDRLKVIGDEAQFLAAVKRGIAAAERREFIEDEERDKRLDVSDYRLGY